MYIGNNVNRSIFCGQTFGLLLNYLEVRYTGILERKYLTEKKRKQSRKSVIASSKGNPLWYVIVR